MDIKKLKITDKIFLLVFKNQKEMASTFLRFQEYYESPEFRRKVFTLKEDKKWYSSVRGSFSYYTDWNGFNIPSYVLKPFVKGKFDPLSKKEGAVLELFSKKRGKFYVIGVHKRSKGTLSTLKHEIAHGLFYTDNGYNKEVVKLLSGFDLSKLKKELGSLGGYHDGVLDDEAHAYSLSNSKKIKTKIPGKLNSGLEKVYQKYLKKNNVCMPEF